MTIRSTELAIAIALISPMAVATSNQALAVSVPGGSVAVKAAAPAASTKVKYRHHTVRHYQNYASGGHRPQDNDTYYGTVGQVTYPPSGYKLPW
jgi:hypothetical protein